MWHNVFLLVLLALSTKIATCQEASAGDSTGDGIYSANRQPQDYTCSYYLAPSKLGGWGVFAGRDFEQNEIVEVTPRFLPVKSAWLNQNVLDDYYYGFLWSRNREDSSFGMASFGMAMWYNHGDGDKHNVQYTSTGMEPNVHFPLYSMAIGFTAKRPIQRGEELLSSYCPPEECAWFSGRGLNMSVPSEEDETPASAEYILQREARYCSKMYAGMGHSTWLYRVMQTNLAEGFSLPQMNHDQHLPLQDHPTAIALQNVQAGETLEMAPALVLPVAQVEGSPLAPTVILWHDWTDEGRQAIMRLREEGVFRVKGVHPEENEIRYDILQYYEDAAVLPIAGNLGMVRKVGLTNEESNCQIEMMPSFQAEEGHEYDYGSAGIALKLTATRDIQAGEELKLDLPDSSSWDAKMNLLQLLAMSGQPVPKHIADPYNPRVVLSPSQTTGDEL